MVDVIIKKDSSLFFNSDNNSSQIILSVCPHIDITSEIKRLQIRRIPNEIIKSKKKSEFYTVAS